MGSDLYDKIIEIGGFSEKIAGFLLLQMLSIVLYLQSQGLRLSKLAAESFHVRFNKGYYQIKFMDLPSIVSNKVSIISLESNINKAKHNKSNLSRDFYSAPEGVANEKNESFSLGVLFCLMLKGYFPFNQEDDGESIEDIYHFNYDDLQEDLSKEGLDLLKSLLDIDYNKRILIKEAVKSPFIEGLDRSFNRCDKKKWINSETNYEILNNPLKRLVRTYMVRFFEKPEEKLELYEMYLEFDKTTEGSVIYEGYKFSFEDFLVIFAKKWNIEPSKGIHMIFKEFAKGKEEIGKESLWEWLGKDIIEKGIIDEMIKGDRMGFEEFVKMFEM